MGTRVWIDAWRMQCCGDAFRVGSEIRWTLHRTPDLAHIAQVTDEAVARSVELAEVHHDDDAADTIAVRATVLRIQAVRVRYGPVGDDPRMLHPIPGTGTLLDVTSADGWDAALDGLELSGYLVDLQSVQDAPAL